MTGYNICSDNHTRNMKSQGNKTLATETIAEAEIEKKGLKNKISGAKNDKHSTCHSK